MTQKDLLEGKKILTGRISRIMIEKKRRELTPRKRQWMQFSAAFSIPHYLTSPKDHVKIVYRQ